MFESNQPPVTLSPTRPNGLPIPIWMENQANKGKRKKTPGQCSMQFLVQRVPACTAGRGVQAEPLVLALARYMSQERISNLALLEHIASIAPETVRRAIVILGWY